MCKIFADDTSFFSKVLDLDKSVAELYTDLQKTSQCANQRKMQFTPDPKKQANEVIFFGKLVSNSLSYPPVIFNNNNITRCFHQKTFGSCVNLYLNFNTHTDQTF